MAIKGKPLSETERWAILNALHAAADVYKSHAASGTLPEQFEKQVQELKDLYARIEQAGGIVLTED